MLFEKHTGFLRGRKRKPQLQKQLHVHPYYLLIYLFIKDRKSTRLNSSHGYISYAVFCLKKKKPRFSPPTTTIFARSLTLARPSPLRLSHRPCRSSPPPNSPTATMASSHKTLPPATPMAT